MVVASSQRAKIILLVGLGVALLSLFSIFPDLDLWFSSLFFGKEGRFVGFDTDIVEWLNDLAYWGARVLGVFFVLMIAFACLWKKPVCGLSPKAWLYLLTALLVGPGLVANMLFKDNWGRARPRDVVVFGGAEAYTPPWVISQACETNCSFVAGDGAFGFFLPSFAYLVAATRRRRVFGATVAMGVAFSAARIVAGAHFLSDVLYAALMMFLTSGGLYALFFGRKSFKAFWKSILFPYP